MRVLVTSTPGFGHVHPLVPIARALQHAGHEVTWATAAAMHPVLERLGFTMRAAGIDQGERRKRTAGTLATLAEVPPRRRRERVFGELFAVAAAPPMLADLQRIADELRPDVIVHEPGELAAAPVAASRGVRHVAVGFGRLIAEPLLAAAADPIAALWRTVGLEPRPSAGLYDHLYLHPLPAALEPLPDVPAIRRVRPLGFDGADDAPAAPWLGAFGRDRPGVYVTFGTEHTGIPPWDVIVEVLGAYDVDAVLTVGRHSDPSRLATLPANVRLERYVPQRALLARTSALISHGGSGAMIGAAIAGIPSSACRSPRISSRMRTPWWRRVPGSRSTHTRSSAARSLRRSSACCAMRICWRRRTRCALRSPPCRTQTRSCASSRSLPR